MQVRLFIKLFSSIFWLLLLSQEIRAAECSQVNNPEFSFSRGANWEYLGGSKFQSLFSPYHGIYTGPYKWPGRRNGSVHWTDDQDNLWLFGGEGFGQSGEIGMLNDLWMYSPVSKKWNFIGGSQLVGDSGNYSTLNGTLWPESRGGALSWKDSTGVIWIFGGSSVGTLDDFWKFDPNTQAWTLISGHGTKVGSYDTFPLYPASRMWAAAWVDSGDNLWLYGGGHSINNGQSVVCLDFWKYIPTTNQWELISGTVPDYNLVYYPSIYFGPYQRPSVRAGMAYWTDNQGKFWMYGGLGDGLFEFYRNDLWNFDPFTKKWSYISGLKTAYNYSNYIDDGSPFPRMLSSFSFNRQSNSLTLFGGLINYVSPSAPSNQYWAYADLWEYKVNSNNWEHQFGSKSAIQNQWNDTSSPSPRYSNTLWTTSSGDIYTFGGFYYYNEMLTSYNTLSSDLWKGKLNKQLSLSTYVNETTVTKITQVLDALRTAEIEIATAPLNGTAFIKSNTTNTLVYTPSHNFHGNDQFDISLKGSSGTCGDKAIVKVTVLNSANPNPISCPAFIQNDGVTKSWEWLSGGSSTNAPGTTNPPDPSPASRYGATRWTDKNGDLWVFGGMGIDASSTWGYLSDLWKYDARTKVWTLRSGDMTINHAGNSSNASLPYRPKGRWGATGWVGKDGSLWMYAGLENDPSYKCLFDLWKFDVVTEKWSLVKTYTKAGAYSGIVHPGGRWSCASWTDNNGNLWLYGGNGHGNNANTLGIAHDLWRYNISSNTWTLISGTGSTAKLAGVYSGASARPGDRCCMSSWTDNNGDFWMFGGQGSANNNTSSGRLNDLWKYTVSTGKWEFKSGGQTLNQFSNYTTIPHPGGRLHSAYSKTTEDEFYLYGGQGYNDVGTDGLLNDVWKYNKNSGAWVFVAGTTVVDQTGDYVGPDFLPRSKQYASSWNSPNGNFHLFGGGKIVSNYGSNDYWRLRNQYKLYVHAGQTTSSLISSIRDQTGYAEIEVTSAPLHGTAFVNIGTTNTISYSANNSFVGNDRFIISVKDFSLSCLKPDTAVVDVTVLEAEKCPVDITPGEAEILWGGSSKDIPDELSAYRRRPVLHGPVSVDKTLTALY